MLRFGTGEKAAQLAVGLVTAAILSLAFVYIAVAQPIMDDWCFAVRSGSPLDQANLIYQQWSGRWPTMFLLTLILQGQAVATSDYLLLAAGGLPIWFAGFVIVADRAIGQGRGTAKLAVAAVMLATFWSTTPGTGETFYWVSSYVTYGLAFLFGAACLSAATRTDSVFHLVTAVFCGFLSATLCELAGILLMIALAAVLLDRILAGRKVGAAAVVLGAVAIGTLVVLLSPGNAIRAAHQSTMSWPKIIWTVIRPYESALALIADPRILALVAATLVLPNPSRQPAARWWLVPVTAIAATYVAVLALVVTTGTAPGYRLLSFMQAGVLSALFLTAWQLRGLANPARPAVHLLFAAVLATAPVVGAALHDLPLAVGDWRQAHRARWEQLHAQQGRDVALTDYANYPSIYPDRDLYADPANGINRCIATYFGVRSVRAIGPDGKRWRTAY